MKEKKKKKKKKQKKDKTLRKAQPMTYLLRYYPQTSPNHRQAFQCCRHCPSLRNSCLRPSLSRSPYARPLSLPFLTAGAAPFQIPSSHLQIADQELLTAVATPRCPMLQKSVMAIASGADGDGSRDKCLAFPVLRTSSLFCLPSSLILPIFGHGDGDAQIFLVTGHLGYALKTLNQGDEYYGI
jgi:hypothetical protein